MSKNQMRLVNITAYISSIDLVLERLVEFPCIDYVPAEQIVQSVHGSHFFDNKDIATPLLNEINEIEKECNSCFSSVKIEGINDSLDEIAKEIKNVHTVINEYSGQLSLLQQLYDKYHNAQTQVSYLASLDLSLDDIFDCEYVNARVGILPLDSVAKLEYYRSTPFIFTSFAEDNNSSWCMYFSTNGYERAVDNIFSSLLFERVYIPDFVHGIPQDAKLSLEKEMEVTQAQIDKTSKSRDEYIKKHQEIVNVMRSELEVMKKIHQIEKYVVGLGSRFSILGFIDSKNIDFIQNLLNDIPNINVEIRPADSDKRIKAPKKLSDKTCGK